VIDHMAVMRRQIEEMQEKALEGRSIAEAMLAEVLAGVVESPNQLGRSEERLVNNAHGAEEPGNASPAYEPPGSPEYIPPQDNMETEVSETPQSFKCSLCGFSVEGVIFELFEHLEEKHGMEDAEEEELEKCCIPIGSKQDEVSAKENSMADSKKPDEGVEEQLEIGGETENKNVDDGAEMDNESGTDEEVVGKEERKAGEDEQEAAVNGEKVDDSEQKVDDSEKQEVDQQEEKGVGLEENKEEQDVVAKDDTVGEDHMDDEDVEDEQDGEPAHSSSSSMSSSVASGVVSTIEELQEALAKTGDHKFIASEELTKSHEYKAFMDNFEGST